MMEDNLKTPFFPLLTPNTLTPKKNELPDDFDDFLPKTTILRVKRRRDESLIDAILLEAEQPVRKKKQMQELTTALQSMKVAQELHAQFENHILQKKQQLSNQLNSNESKVETNAKNDQKSTSTETNPDSNSKDVKSEKADADIVNKIPELPWSAPSKTLESQLRKLFRFIGSEDPKKTENNVTHLVNDIQSGRAKKRDIVNAIKKRTADGERKARSAEAQKIHAAKSFMLRNISQEAHRAKYRDDKKQNPVEEESMEDAPFKLLELFQEQKSETEKPISKPVQSTYSRPSNVKLPTVYSARELQLQADKRARKMAMESDVVIDYYVLDEEAILSEVEEIQHVQVPFEAFKQELLNDYVLEGEYSDSDEAGAESDDSQNARYSTNHSLTNQREEDWDYGSSSDEANSDKSDEEEVDEMFDEDSEYHHRHYSTRGYDLEIDPEADMEDDEDY